MSIYLANYWPLYSEFIQATEELTYRDVPLGLMINFYQLIDDELRSEMGSTTFRQKLKHPGIEEQQEIQPFLRRSSLRSISL